MTAVALKPCARGSFSGAVTKGCAGLAPPAAAAPGAFAAQDCATEPTCEFAELDYGSFTKNTTAMCN